MVFQFHLDVHNVFQYFPYHQIRNDNTYLVLKRFFQHPASGESMEYFDDEKKEKYIPYVIEPSLGADRVTLAFLCYFLFQNLLSIQNDRAIFLKIQIFFQNTLLNLLF